METTEDKLKKPWVDKVAMVLDRKTKMATERSKLESERDTCEKQVLAPVYTDNDGKIIYNTQTDQNLLEQYVGRTNNQVFFDFKPEQQADANDIKSSEAITEYFLEKENRYRELSIWDYSKGKYGSGIRDTWLHMDTELKYKPKEWAKTEDSTTWGIDDNSLFEEYTQVNRSFTGKNVRIRDLYIDDKAIRQPNRELVEDVIKVEYISLDKLTQRRWKNKRYDIIDLMPMDWDNNNKQVIKLYIYDNKITKDHIIVGNDKKLVYAWKNKYKAGKLPYEVCQHYMDDSCIYGKSIPLKTRAPKGYQNNMMQAMLDKTWSAAFNNIILGNGNVLNDNYKMWWWINIREVSNIADFQQYQNNGDINWLAAVIEILKEEIRMNTGEDPAAWFVPPAEQLGTVEIMEENKAIRQKSVAISRDLCLDNVITRAYENIQQFAPVLLRRTEVIKTEDWKEIDKVVRPLISLPWIKVEKKWGKQVLEETDDYWYYGRYELNPKFRMIDGNVKVVTNASYNKAWSVLEKNKVSELATVLQTLGTVYWPAVTESAPFKAVWTMVQQAYGYDGNNEFGASTKKDKVRQKNLELIKELQDKMSLSKPPLPPEQQIENDKINNQPAVVWNQMPNMRPQPWTTEMPEVAWGVWAEEDILQE